MKSEKGTKVQSTKGKQYNYKLIGIISAVIILVITVLMLVETDGGFLIINNNSDVKIEYVKAYFVNVEGPFTEELKVENLEPSKKQNLFYDQIDLYPQQANLEIKFKLENQEEMFVDAGYFNDVLKGNINVSFDQKDDNNITLSVQAKNGILPSSTIVCDEEFNIYLDEGYVD
ncbi:MAG: hypothetical protein K0S47_1759 [Herbinix sp.]|nr:hypothetical protein [Herbinix sp.]